MIKDLPHIKSPGFKTPDNYFDSLKEQVMLKMALEERVSKNNPFQVPAGYFDGITEAVISQTSEKKPITKVIPLYNKKIIKYAAAVAALVLVAVTVFEFKNPVLSTSESFFTSSTLIESDYLDMSLIDIEYLVTDDMLDEQQFLSAINQQELEDYLLYELEDNDLLYE